MKYLILFFFISSAYAGDFNLPAKQARLISNQANDKYEKKCISDWTKNLESGIKQKIKDGEFSFEFYKSTCLFDKDFQNELNKLKNLGYEVVKMDDSIYRVCW